MSEDSSDQGPSSAANQKIAETPRQGECFTWLFPLTPCCLQTRLESYAWRSPYLNMPGQIVGSAPAGTDHTLNVAGGRLTLFLPDRCRWGGGGP